MNRKESSWPNHRTAYAVLLLCAVAFLLTPALGFSTMSYPVPDFKTVYSSARALADGGDPYNSGVLLEQYREGGGEVSAKSHLSAFLPHQALYPPSSLFWIFPFALLPWRSALIAWLVVSGCLFVTSTFLIADICCQWDSGIPIILLGVFLATSTLLLTTAQPSAVAISLCVIGVWSLVRDRWIGLGVISFALSLAIKPQIGGPLLLYYLLSRSNNRRRAVMIVVATVILCLPGIFWAANSPAASNWPHELHTNIAASSKPGQINDPGPSSYNAPLIIDLQSVIALFDNNPSSYNRVSWGIVGALIVMWGFAAWWGRPSLEKDLLGLATIACLGLLPIYHRHYDLRLLIVTFPACALLMVKGRMMARGVPLLPPLAAIACSHPTFIRDHLHLQQASMGPIETMFLLRLASITVLVSGIFYLVLFWRASVGPRYRDNGVRNEVSTCLVPAFDGSDRE